MDGRTTCRRGTTSSELDHSRRDVEICGSDRAGDRMRKPRAARVFASELATCVLCGFFRSRRVSYEEVYGGVQRRPLPAVRCNTWLSGNAFNFGGKLVQH
jgi:hypothetical protein